MAWRSSAPTHAELISNLFTHKLITTPRLQAAMLSIDRGTFCPPLPPNSPYSPYADSPMPLTLPSPSSPFSSTEQRIPTAATISAPHMHAMALESLLPFIPSTGGRALDVGSGSGYLTAVLAELVGPTGRVVGLENIEGLRGLGEENVRRLEGGRGMEWLESGRVRFVMSDGRLGWLGGGSGGGDGDGGGEEQWDVIHVGAAAARLHEELVRQLRRPGRLFIPVEDERGMGQHIWVVDKDEKGVVKKERLYGVSYVPLTDAPKQR